MIADIINFQVHGDHDGSLVALEKGAEFPFEIKRVYYIWGTAPHVVRGHHAHKNLEQVVVCTSGSCDFTLDDGTHRETYHLLIRRRRGFISKTTSGVSSRTSRRTAS